MTDFEKCYTEAKNTMLPFESWERLAGESAAAFAAFCTFRDYGAERNIKRALASVECDSSMQTKRYRMWRLWSSQFRWSKRADDYDVYLDRLKLAERRKLIEQRAEVYMLTTGKALTLVNKKLDTMDANELSQNNLVSLMTAAIGTEREVLGAVNDKARNEKQDTQPVLNFGNDFEGM
jgi:hypothetical protein